MATIKDVARVAGVSIATVSATLNGTARVSEKRSRRIWDAIQEVGYTPHGIARSLRLGHTRSIGLVVGDISNPFFTSLAKAVEARAAVALPVRDRSGSIIGVVGAAFMEDREIGGAELERLQKASGSLVALAETPG